MFGSKRAASFTLDQVETIIGKDTQFKGTITAKGSIRIDGQLEGDITTTGDLVVGDSGRVTAQVKARCATVSGVITGNVDILDKLELMPTAKVYGDIKVGVLIVGEGAVYKGACEMRNSDAESGKPVSGKK